MSTLLEAMESIKESAKANLENAVRQKRPLMPIVLAERDDNVVAIIGINQHDRDLILAIASLAIGGYGADLVAIGHDSYHATIPCNPRTGEPWGAGEMQDVVKHDHALERGWVSDALILQGADRAGHIGIIINPYRVSHGRKVTWQEPMVMDYAEGATGIMPDALRQAMNRPAVSVLEMDIPAGLGRDAIRDVMDCITSELITAAGGMVKLTATPGTDRAENITRFFAKNIGVAVTVIPPLFSAN